MKKATQQIASTLTCILILSISIAFGQAVSRSTAESSEVQLANLVAQVNGAKRPAFSLMPSSRAVKLNGSAFNITPMAGGPSLTVMGGGTLGRLTKWTGFTSSNSFIGDSTIFEDKLGKVGIGTDTPTSKLTVAGMIEITLGGLKFPDGTLQTTAFDPNQVVSSLNGLRGDLFLVGGPNIVITPSGGNTLTIAAPNVLTSVIHNATLTGNGTAASPLGIADGGVGTTQLANNAVTTAKIADAAVTAPKIGSAQVVKSINTLKDDVTLAAGSNITITPSGNTLTLAAATGLSAVTTDFTLKGNGTSGSPLGVKAPLFLSANSSGAVIEGVNTSTASLAIGVRGRTPSNGNGIGVLGDGGNLNLGVGVMGVGAFGVVAEAIQGGIALKARPAPGVTSWNAASFDGLVSIFGDLFVTHDLQVVGDKDFVEPHPTDPNKMIAYVALEGPEAGTYFRGSGRLVNGFANIDIPEDFRMVTDEKGITVQVTPMGEPAMIWCVRKSLDKIELRGSADVEFDFIVNGVRRMSKDRKAIVENTVFVPRTADDDSLTRIKKPEAIRRLKSTGILNEDGSINMETVQKLDAYKRQFKQQ
jgi:hypothetical protein